MIGLLVHQPTLNTMLNMSWTELYAKMERGELRSSRPLQDEVLTTTFAIDAEAELLDWMEQQQVDGAVKVSTALGTRTNGAEGLLQIMRFASPGQWEVWEGRAFLYLEVAIGRRASDIHELYDEEVWKLTFERLDNMSNEEFAQAVVLDWMERRKGLGETLEESQDPKIIPTFEAHTRAAKALVHLVSRVQNEPELVFILGREHLDAAKWGHGVWNLSAFVQSL